MSLYLDNPALFESLVRKLQLKMIPGTPQQQFPMLLNEEVRLVSNIDDFLPVNTIKSAQYTIGVSELNTAASLPAGAGEDNNVFAGYTSKIAHLLYIGMHVAAPPGAANGAHFAYWNFVNQQPNTGINTQDNTGQVAYGSVVGINAYKNKIPFSSISRMLLHYQNNTDVAQTNTRSWFILSLDEATA